ncbi:MAG: hypothetical protein JWO08_1518 [Verrucomicrobiaceae bacterium]|nr:hypothetical protein [Verrucomicrobiaceae bacterium]
MDRPTELAPLADQERHTTLDVLRGVALFGVLWVNLQTSFRLSLFEHLFTFHTHGGWVNEWIDLVTAWLIEFKAFTVFSFLFGVGACIQAERTASRGISASRFMLRRFAVLLGIGLGHMFLVWNGDILCLYAICGILLIPLIRLPSAALVALGLAAISLTFLPISSALIPSAEAMRTQAAASTPVYAHGTYHQIFVVSWTETWYFIVPLLISALPKTFGLMLLGIASWRSGILKQPARHRRLLAGIFGCFTAVGALATSMIFWSASTGRALPVPPALVDAFSYVPLALGLTAGLVLWLNWSSAGPIAHLFAAAGQMALTNYLMQSLVFSLVFYGFGLGLFGRLSPASAGLIGIGVFALQLVASRTWLRHYRFGPMEWLWRSFTYRQAQPMRRTVPSRRL